MNNRGIFRLRDMIGSPDCEAGMPDGSYVRAVPLPFYFGLLARLTAAWAVLRGCDNQGRGVVAVEWPQPGELEKAVGGLPIERQRTSKFRVAPHSPILGGQER